jgi:hypothetical protein
MGTGRRGVEQMIGQNQQILLRQAARRAAQLFEFQQNSERRVVEEEKRHREMRPRWMPERGTESERHGRSPMKFGAATCVSSALSLASDAPYHIAHIICHEQGAVGADRYSDRSSVGHPFIRCEAPR